MLYNTFRNVLDSKWRRAYQSPCPCNDSGYWNKTIACDCVHNRIETSAPHTLQTRVYNCMPYSAGEAQMCNCLDLSLYQASVIQEWCLPVLSCLFSGYEYFLLVATVSDQECSVHRTVYCYNVRYSTHCATEMYA